MSRHRYQTRDVCAARGKHKPIDRQAPAATYTQKQKGEEKERKNYYYYYYYYEEWEKNVFDTRKAQYTYSATTMLCTCVFFFFL